MAKFSTEDIRLAQQVQEKYGWPASVTLAQYALESSYGTSKLATTKNNYFGMTLSKGGYQTHNSKADSFDRYGKLMTGSIYSGKTKNATTPEEYLYAIADTYAPPSDGNENYAEKAISIINDYNLKQYDTTNGATLTTDTATDAADRDSGGFSGIADSVLSWLIKAVAIVFIVALAGIFFMQAFNLKIPTAKNVMKKALEKGGEK